MQEEEEVEGLWQGRPWYCGQKVTRVHAGPQKKQGVGPTLLRINEAFLAVRARVCPWGLCVRVHTCAVCVLAPWGSACACTHGHLQVILHVQCIHVCGSGCASVWVGVMVRAHGCGFV